MRLLLIDVALLQKEGQLICCCTVHYVDVLYVLKSISPLESGYGWRERDADISTEQRETSMLVSQHQIFGSNGTHILCIYPFISNQTILIPYCALR